MKNRIVAPSRLVSALDACRSRLKAFIRGRTPLRDEADDILQEVTYQLIRVEQPVENIAAWLFRAARNEMTDRARKKRMLMGGMTVNADIVIDRKPLINLLIAPLERVRKRFID